MSEATTPGVATLGRQAAGEGLSGLGWGWSRTSDLNAVPSPWRTTTWVDWARLAGGQRSSGGALAVARLVDGVAVASLEPERTVVTAPVGTDVAGALSLRGHPVWGDRSLDVGLVEDSAAINLSDLGSLSDQVRGLLQLLWSPSRAAAVAVVDLSPTSPWVAALRVVSDLVGVESVVIGAGRVLDDAEGAPQLQLVEPGVATLWSQETGRYPALRSDTFDVGQVPVGPGRLADALLLTGGVRGLTVALRTSGAWDGTWPALRDLVDVHFDRWGALPVLPAGVQPTDRLSTLAGTAEGRAWLMEDAAGEQVAWQGRTRNSFEALREADAEAHAALATLALVSWDRDDDPQAQLAILQLMGPGLIDDPTLRELATSLVARLRQGSLLDLLEWARKERVHVDVDEARLVSQLSLCDEVEARRLFRLLQDPVQLAADAVAAPRWLPWWLDAVEGAFTALMQVEGGPQRIVAEIVHGSIVLTDARAAEATSLTTANKRIASRVASGVFGQEMGTVDDIVIVIDSAGVPLLGEHVRTWFLDEMATRRKADLTTLLAASRAMHADWRPASALVVAALERLADGSDDEVDELLDTEPELSDLLAAAERGGPWAARWLGREGTIERLLDDASGRRYLVIRNDLWEDETEKAVARRALQVAARQAQWVATVRSQINARRESRAKRDVVDRLARPVLDDPKVIEDLVDEVLQALPSGLDEASLLDALLWVEGPRLGKAGWSRLPEIAQRKQSMSIELARQFVAVGVDAALVVGGLTPLPKSWLWDLDDDEDLMTAVIARVVGGWEVFDQSDLVDGRLPERPRARRAVNDALGRGNMPPEQRIVALLPEQGPSLVAQMKGSFEEEIAQRRAIAKQLGEENTQLKRRVDEAEKTRAEAVAWASKAEEQRRAEQDRADGERARRDDAVAEKDRLVGQLREAKDRANAVVVADRGAGSGLGSRPLVAEGTAASLPTHAEDDAVSTEVPIEGDAADDRPQVMREARPDTERVEDLLYAATEHSPASDVTQRLWAGTEPPAPSDVADGFGSDRTHGPPASGSGKARKVALIVAVLGGTLVVAGAIAATGGTAIEALGILLALLVAVAGAEWLLDLSASLPGTAPPAEATARWSTPDDAAGGPGAQADPDGRQRSPEQGTPAPSPDVAEQQEPHRSAPKKKSSKKGGGR